MNTDKTAFHWKELLGGHRWHYGYDKPQQLKLSVHDVAVPLSNICRFGGHTKRFYSVAQHSVHVSRLLDLNPEWAMAGLLHDAHEIIVGDINSPMKWYLGKELAAKLDAEESRAYGTIALSLGVAVNLTPDGERVLKHADLVALMTEKRDLMDPRVKWDYFDDIRPDPKRIHVLAPEEAARKFVARFRALKKRLRNAK